MSFSGVVFVVSLFLSSVAYAQFGLTQLINPGPLSEPHAIYEGAKNCTVCHVTAKGVPDQKCLDCHPEIKSRVRKKEGYHARQTDKCAKCHPEHKGRAFDINPLSRVSFDHADTGWTLTGAHLNLDCRRCHKERRVNVETKKLTRRPTYLGNSSACISCHKDVHNSGNPDLEKCERCHTTEKRKSLRTRLAYDHNRESAFPLTGRHKKVGCTKCHKKNSWKVSSFTSCSNCHRDPHKGKNGVKCERCHITDGFKKVLVKGHKGFFDHAKTRFPLTGEHQKVKCSRCHGSEIGKMRAFGQCSDCHTNPHKDEFQKLWSKKKVCSDCHVTDDWRILRFQHNRDSRYDLKGKHKEVPCEQCHVDRKYRWMVKSPDCDKCHVDVHNNQFKKTCASCHTEKGFNKPTFDHNKDSQFPLIGKHAPLTCNKCHEKGKFKGMDRRCQGCHVDFHEEQLGTECARCHSPRGFNDVEFDHKRESKFRRDGAHEKVACNKCHLDYHFRPIPQDCSNCHEDVHRGIFGTACDRCHNTQSFEPRPGYHDFGEFSLGGVHNTVECITCHGPKAAIRLGGTQCGACHKDPHMGSLGPTCSTCHSQFAWLPTTFRHNQTGFELSGAHRFVSCDQCHHNRVFGGLPQDCGFCHQKDFSPILPGHVGASNQCESCHFTFGWRPAPK